LGVSLLTFVFGVLGCHNNLSPKRTEISDTAMLRSEILKSIVIPFKKLDTIILSEMSGYVECGNLTKEEIANLPNPFYTMLDKKPFIQEFAKLNNCEVITSKLFFDSVSNNRQHDFSIDSIYANKIQMTIDAEILEDGSVIVHERYRLNGVDKNIGKIFSLDNKQVWHYE